MQERTKRYQDVRYISLEPVIFNGFFRKFCSYNVSRETYKRLAEQTGVKKIYNLEQIKKQFFQNWAAVEIGLYERLQNPVMQSDAQERKAAVIKANFIICEYKKYALQAAGKYFIIRSIKLVFIIYRIGTDLLTSKDTKE